MDKHPFKPYPTKGKHGCVQCPYAKKHPIHKTRSKGPRINWKKIMNRGRAKIW